MIHYDLYLNRYSMLPTDINIPTTYSTLEAVVEKNMALNPNIVHKKKDSVMLLFNSVKVIYYEARNGWRF